MHCCSDAYRADFFKRATPFVVRTPWDSVEDKSWSDSGGQKSWGRADWRITQVATASQWGELQRFAAAGEDTSGALANWLRRPRL